MCRSLGPLARGPSFIQLAFYRNTSTPPPVHWDQARLRKGHKSPTQNSIQSSRTADWKGSRKGDGGRSKPGYLPKQPERVCRKASARARERSSERHREKTPSRRQVGEPPGRGPGVPPGLGRDQLGAGCRLLLRSLGGPRVPAAAGPAAAVSALYRGLPAARGRSLGSVSGRPAPGSRGPMSPGRGDPSRLPRRPHQAPGAETTAGAGGGGPAARGDRNLISQRRGLLPIPGRPGLFRSPHGRRRRRLLPDAPVGGGSREGREVPVRPGLEAPAPEAGGGGGGGGATRATTRSAGPARRVPGPSRERARRAEEAGGGGGRATIAGARTGSGSGSVFPAPAASSASSRFPSPADFFGLLLSDFGKPPHPGSLRGARGRRAALAARPRSSPPPPTRSPVPRGRLRWSPVWGSEKVVLRGGGRWEQADSGSPAHRPSVAPKAPGTLESCTLGSSLY